MTAWQYTRLAIGATLTWAILIFLNETYKELLKRHGLPGRFIDAIRSYYRSVSNRAKRFGEMAASDSEPTVVKIDPKTDLLKSRRRIRRYALPPQVGILSLIVVGLFQIAFRSAGQPDDNLGVVTFFFVLASVYLAILIMSYIILEIVFCLQLRQSDFAKFGKIRAAAKEFIMLPYDLIFQLILAAIAFAILGGTLVVAIFLIEFLVSTIYEFAASPHH